MRTGIIFIFITCIAGLVAAKQAATWSWRLPNNTQGRIVNGMPALWKYRKGTALVMYDDYQ